MSERKTPPFLLESTAMVSVTQVEPGMKTATQCFVGPSDTHVVVEVSHFEAWDCPGAHIRIRMIDGLFFANGEGFIPPVGRIGEEDEVIAVISFRDRGMAEAALMRRALRWAADQLEDDIVTEGDA